MTKNFVTWLMALTRMMRYVVIAVLFHVLLLAILGSIKIIAILPKIVAKFEGAPLPPATPAEPDPFLAYREFEYKGLTQGGGGGTPGKGPGGIPTAAGITPKEYRASILQSETPAAEPQVGEVIGVVNEAESGASRLEGSLGGMSTPTVGLGESSMGAAGVSGPGGGGFGQRQGPMRAQALQKYQGGMETERAVLAGLRWLKANQRMDGSWHCYKSDQAGSGLAILAFLGHGETTDSPEFGQTVNKGLEYLVNSIGPDGIVVDKSMYAQGIVTLSLSEAYGMTQSPAVKEPLDRALNAILTIQKVKKMDAKFVGGWRYSSTSGDADTSVTGWMIMALKSAKLAGIAVPEEAFDMASRYLWQMYGDGGFGYDHPAKAVVPTAIGVLCQQFMGHSDDERIRKALRFLGKQKVEWETEGGFALYGWYYQTQAMFQGGGSYWAYWNQQIRNTMVKSQADDGHWPTPPKSSEATDLDKTPVYATALSALILEVYYRYLPIYQISERPTLTSAARPMESN
jgi:hypothetical protein